MTDEQLRELVAKARTIAAPVGPMHALWDVIFDAEALLEGRKPLIDDRDYIEQTLARSVGAGKDDGRS